MQPRNIQRWRASLLSRSDGIGAHIERVLVVLETFNEQLKQADKELLAIAEEDPVRNRLMTVPGVGPVIAIRFVAVIDQPGRFHSSHHLISYLGLTPGENSSSERSHRTGITKAGASDLRFALVQGAWNLMRHRPNKPMSAWVLAIAVRRHKQVAVVALARKLVGLLWAMWRRERDYKPDTTTA